MTDFSVHQWSNFNFPGYSVWFWHTLTVTLVSVCMWLYHIRLKLNNAHTHTHMCTHLEIKIRIILCLNTIINEALTEVFHIKQQKQKTVWQCLETSLDHRILNNHCQTKDKNTVRQTPDEKLHTVVMLIVLKNMIWVLPAPLPFSHSKIDLGFGEVHQKDLFKQLHLFSFIAAGLVGLLLLPLWDVFWLCAQLSWIAYGFLNRRLSCF